MSMPAGQVQAAQPARGGRTIAGFPLVYWVLAGGAAGGFFLWRRSKAGAASLVGAGTTPAASAYPNAGTGLVPTAGYGSVNAPGAGSTDWASVISQLGQINNAAGAGQGGSGLPPGSAQGVVTNPPQVAYGAADPAHPIKGLTDELTHLKRWVSKPGGANIPGGPVGYGAPGGENTPNVYTTSSGAIYSELPGGSAFQSVLGSCQQMFWQPNPGTFVNYPTRKAGSGCTRAAGAPAYGTPVFVKE